MKRHAVPLMFRVPIPRLRYPCARGRNRQVDVDIRGDGQPTREDWLRLSQLGREAISLAFPSFRWF